MGFSREAPSIYEFPLEMFAPASDLTPIEENIDKLIFGLTKWQPTIKERKVEAPDSVIVEGADYEQAMAAMNSVFLRNAWSDGLPLLPATEHRVSWILSGTALDPATVVGKILPKGRIATVETLAVNLAMAGGRPEYLPVLIATIQGIIEPVVRHQVFNTTTCSVYPAVIVNGPIAKQIRLGSGYGCLGPNSEYPAGAAIGRAIRLILLNVGGAIPGKGSMAIFGANRYTNVVFAEDEDGLPPGWEPLNASYFGYPRGANTVAVHPVAGTNNINNTPVGDAATALTTLHTLAGFMAVPNWNYWSGDMRFDGAPGVILIARGTAQALARLGWSKEKIQAFLWDHSHLPWSMIKNGCPPQKLESRAKLHTPNLPMNKAWPVTSRPENIMIVIAGGEQSGHDYWMQAGTSFKPVCRKIELPANWDELLWNTEKELGPAPTV